MPRQISQYLAAKNAKVIFPMAAKLFMKNILLLMVVLMCYKSLLIVASTPHENMPTLLDIGFFGGLLMHGITSFASVVFDREYGWNAEETLQFAYAGVGAIIMIASITL